MKENEIIGIKRVLLESINRTRLHEGGNAAKQVGRLDTWKAKGRNTNTRLDLYALDKI
jgi:hypothetical protein